MAQYTIALDKFYVLTTRSVHEDTDYVTLTVQVNQQTPLNRDVVINYAARSKALIPTPTGCCRWC